MPTTEIRLALDATAKRRTERALDELFGKRYWTDSQKYASKALSRFFRESHKMGKRSADIMGVQFSKKFREMSVGFSDHLEKAAASGSDSYIDAMKKAVGRVAKLQARQHKVTKDQLEDIMKSELEVLDEKLKAEQKITKLRNKQVGEAPSARFGARGGGDTAWGRRAGELSDKLQGAGSRVSDFGKRLSGRARSLARGAGGAMRNLAAVAGRLGSAVGSIVAAGAAMGTVAKQLLDVVNRMNQLNKSLMAGSGAADLQAAGFGDVQQGINALRQEFTRGVRENFRWRMTADEAMQAYSAYAQAGVKVSQVQRDIGRSSTYAAREMVTTARTYGTLLSIGEQEVAQFIAEATNEMGYSFDFAEEALSNINKQSLRSGMSVSVFFGKVQSVNSQLDVLNSNLKVQAKLLADITGEDAALGFERAAAALGRIEGSMDFDTALKVLTTAGDSNMQTILQSRLSAIEAALKSDDIDKGLKRRLEAEKQEITQALTGGLKEQADYFVSSLSDGTSEMWARMAAVAKVFGKEFDELTASDLDVGLSYEQRLEFVELAGLGAEGEVTPTLLAIQDLLGDKTALEAIQDALSVQSDQDTRSDRQIAQAQLAMTEDTTKILTDMKNILQEKVYGVLFKMYKFSIKVSGSSQQEAVVGYMEAVDRTQMDINKALSEGDKSEAERLLGVLDVLKEEQRNIELATPEEFEDFLKTKGGGNLHIALTARTGREGDIAKGAGAMTMMTGREREELQARSARSRGKSRDHIQIASLLAQEIVSGVGFDTKDDARFGAWVRGLPPEARRYPTPVLQALFWAAYQPDLISNMDHVRSMVHELNAAKGIPAMAEGGVVTRPTIALLGEAGPEAVIPLGRGGGGFHFHVHGNVYGVDDLKNIMGRALRDYDRSQRV